MLHSVMGGLNVVSQGKLLVAVTRIERVTRGL